MVCRRIILNLRVVALYGCIHGKPGSVHINILLRSAIVAESRVFLLPNVFYSPSHVLHLNL